MGILQGQHCGCFGFSVQALEKKAIHVGIDSAFLVGDLQFVFSIDHCWACL